MWDLNRWLVNRGDAIEESPEHQQAVNFNYNRENIYTLFKALRLSDEIARK